ncbi:hypothetical protein C8Q78DRAFT_1142731 [Trametes maxima]|nr:hypothetical protein C8Q78DRAFT_1142731 [Trametes maxima]
MQEEQDTCRICSAPAEPDQPLFHPCRCSGTIRYIHQDCLTEWLQHSKKKTCDVCKHPYSFTKVYAKNMPERLPFFLILRQFSRQLVSAILFGLRAALVSSIWLAALPWATIWTWRMYFAMGNHAAWWISALKRPEHDPDMFDDLSTPLNTTVANSTVTPDLQASAHTGFLTHPLILQVSSDIVAGQIIASMIVIAFVAVFLLREWITQNARPGIFEDEDMVMEVNEVDALPPLPENAHPAPDLRDIPAAPLPPQVAHDDGPQQGYTAGPIRRDAFNQAEVGPQRKAKKPRIEDGATTSGDASEAGSARHTRPRNKEHAAVRGRLRGKSLSVRRSSRAAEKARLQTRDEEDSTEDAEVLAQKEREFRRLPYVRRWSASQSEPGPIGEGVSEQWPPDRSGHRHLKNKNALPAFAEFSFAIPASSLSSPSPSTEAASSSAHIMTPPRADGYGEPPTRNPFSPPLQLLEDSSTEEDEQATTPTYPIPSSAGPSNWQTETRPRDVGAELPPPLPPTTASQSLRRPPLPTVTLPPSPGLASGPSSAISSRRHTPLASPSLATYRPPEDLHPGEQNDYFVERWFADLVDADRVDEAHREFFEDPEEPRRDAVQRQRDFEDIAEAERQAAAELAERGEMADGEQDAEGFNEEDNDVRWTDDEFAIDADEDDDDDDEEGDEDGDEEGDEDGDEDAEEEDDEDDGMALDGVRPRDEGDNGEGNDALIAEEDPRQEVEPLPPAPDDFENDVNIEDDMDGALEAIGLRGPLYGVLQNAILMTFILDTTIGLGVWLPFTIGKTAALLTLNPRRAMQILHLPLRVIRFITDPVVDTALLVCSRLLLPPLDSLSRLVVALFLSVVSSLAGPDRSEQLTGAVNSVRSHAMQVATRVLEGATSSTPSEVVEAESTASYLYRLLEEDTTIMRVVEPYFAPLGENINQLSAQGKETWVELATGDDRHDRIFAVFLGYAVVGLVLAIYLNVLTVGTMRNAGRAVRSAIRQQLLVVKVASFIIIELIIFPLGCGMMLDICSGWMFPHGTFRSRAALLFFAPLRAIFYHWILGTMFMYQFAVLLSGCRSIMRPGAMWFIKDPQDQNFHPIRDILERPTFVQLRKLLLSAAMYGIVVASGVATISSILRLFRGIIMPFRWKLREPLSEIPIDLIFIQLVLPYTMEHFRPRKALRRFGTTVWKYFARQLRLSSYMFGGRHPSEEYTPKYWQWRSLHNDGLQMDDAEASHDGTFRRVPNNDNVALVKGIPATVQVDEEGYPLNVDGIRLIILQDTEADKAKRRIKEDYAVVYIPPQFKYRVLTFLLCLWSVGSAFLATFLAAPVLLGRGFFRLFVPYDVHDGYSFIVGFYLLWGCWLVGSALDRMDKRRQRRWTEERPAEWPLYVLKRGLLWISQASYMIVTLGVIIPTLMGLVVELYIIQPIKHTANPLVEPRIRMVDMWALGLLYTKIIVRVMRQQQARHERMRGVERLFRNGWLHMDPINATMDVIAPVSAGLLAMIVLPAACVWAATHLVTLPIDGDFLFLHVYPGIFTLAGLGHATWVLSRAMTSWSQTIRDKEFLVEMRLRNLEERQTADRGREAKKRAIVIPIGEVE